MANTLFPKGREGFTIGDIQWDADDIRVMLVKSTYTYVSTHAYVSDLGAVDNGRSTAFASKTYTNGILDAADINITATTAAACNALILFKHTGLDTSARLIGYIDTGTGLPVTAAGGSTYTIVWPSTDNIILKLSVNHGES